MPSAADAELQRAVAALAAGRLVAFPTETVWGIAADAFQPAAVEGLRRFKGRDPAQPISVLVPEPEALRELGCELGDGGEALAAAFWPGPVTLVCRCDPGSRLAALANEGGGVGIRCSPHPVADALARAALAAGLGPLTATSCNLAGAPAARTREEARRVCAPSPAGDGPFVLASGADASGARPSTVVDLLARPPRVLREGAVAASAIRDVLATSARIRDGEVRGPATGGAA